MKFKVTFCMQYKMSRRRKTYKHDSKTHICTFCSFSVCDSTPCDNFQYRIKVTNRKCVSYSNMSES